MAAAFLPQDRCMRSCLALAVLALLGAAIPAADARVVAPEIVTVVASGSSDRFSSTSQSFSYGVVLHNKSTSRDALGVQLRVAATGPSGVIGIYLTSIPMIPAGGTFYVGNEPVTIGTSHRATGIIVGVTSSGRQLKHGRLPVVSARIARGRVQGSLTNPYATGRRIRTTQTKLYAVYLDRRGKVLGGERLHGVRFARRPLIASKQTSTFTASLGRAVSASRIATVRVSAVPRIVEPR